MRDLKRYEDIAILLAAALLAVWAFSDRSDPTWLVPLGAAIVILLAVLVRRLRGWMRLTDGGGEDR